MKVEVVEMPSLLPTSPMMVESVDSKNSTTTVFSPGMAGVFKSATAAASEDMDEDAVGQIIFDAMVNAVKGNSSKLDKSGDATTATQQEQENSDDKDKDAAEKEDNELNSSDESPNNETKMEEEEKTGTTATIVDNNSSSVVLNTARSIETIQEAATATFQEKNSGKVLPPRSSGGNTATVPAVKRKLATINNQISLYVFTQILDELCETTQFEVNKKSWCLKLYNIADCIDNIERYKTDSSSASVSSCSAPMVLDRKRPRVASSDGNQENNDVNSEGGETASPTPTCMTLKAIEGKDRQVAMLKILTRLLQELEERNYTLQFSREYLKYFLATHERWVQAKDFSETNRVAKKSKKHKMPVRLVNGAILVEYVKTPEMFASNLNRCEPEDVEALRIIVSQGISISPNIYNIIRHYKSLPQIQYKTEEQKCERHDSAAYAYIPIHHFKRSVLIVTKNILMVHDQQNNQFLLPPVNLEREFTTATLQSIKYNVVILDVLMSKKVEIIDIYLNHNERGDLDVEQYLARLALAAKTFPNIRTVQPIENNDDESSSMSSGNSSSDESVGGSAGTGGRFTTPLSSSHHQQAIDYGYIRKAKRGTNEINYVYTKPCLTVGIVAVRDKQAYIVCKQNNTTATSLPPPPSPTTIAATNSTDGATATVAAPQQPSAATKTLVYKGKINICGTSSILVSTAQIVSRSNPTILYDEKPHNIVELPQELQDERGNWSLFKRAVTVELRDNNKMGSLSLNDISDVSEYRVAQTSTKETSPINIACLADDEQRTAFINSIMRTSFGPKLLEQMLRAAAPYNQRMLEF